MSCIVMRSKVLLGQLVLVFLLVMSGERVEAGAFALREHSAAGEALSFAGTAAGAAGDFFHKNGVIYVKVMYIGLTRFIYLITKLDLIIYQISSRTRSRSHFSTSHHQFGIEF